MERASHQVVCGRCTGVFSSGCYAEPQFRQNMLHCSLFLLKSNRVELTVVFKSSSIVIQPIDAQESFDIAHGHPLTTSLDHQSWCHWVTQSHSSFQLLILKSSQLTELGGWMRLLRGAEAPLWGSLVLSAAFFALSRYALSPVQAFNCFH